MGGQRQASTSAQTFTAISIGRCHPAQQDKSVWFQVDSPFQANAEVNPNLIILVKIHREARYEPMVDMMDSLEDAHMERFSLIPMNPADAAMLEAMR